MYPQKRIKSPNYEIIPVNGDGNCAFYAFAIGLMENIFSGRLPLDLAKHTSFIYAFGQEILDGEEKASPEQVVTWVRANYPERHEFEVYQKLNSVLRILTRELVNEDWNNIAKKMLDDLIAMVNQVKEAKLNSINIRDFYAIFDASDLKEGQFGFHLKHSIGKIKNSIGTKAWRDLIRQWLNENKNKNLYLNSVIDKLWASKKIELPLLGKYFSISVYVDNERIYQSTGQGEIGLVMPRGTHYDYQVRSANGNPPTSKKNSAVKNKKSSDESSNKSDPSSRPLKRLKKITAIDEDKDVDSAEVDETPTSKPVTRGEKLVKMAREEKNEKTALGVALKRTVQARRSLPTEEEDSLYHAVFGKYSPQKQKIYHDSFQESKHRFFDDLKSTAESSDGCDFFRMSEPEFETAQKKKSIKERAYVFIEKDPLKDSKLFHINSLEQCELVAIEDFEVFHGTLADILPDEQTTTLSDENVDCLVTSNGGHVPSELFRLRSEAIKNFIIDGCCEDEKSVSGTCAAYSIHATAVEVRKQPWREFEKYLYQHQVILDFIAESTSLDRADTLQNKFNDALRRNRAILYGLIASVPSLQQQFNNYREKLSEGFNWSGITQNPTIVTSYLNYLQNKAPGFLPVELHIFSFIFEVRVALYVEFHDVPIFVEIFDYGVGSLREIQLDNLNNFKKLEKTPELSFQTIIKGKRSNHISAEITDPIKMIEKLRGMLAVLDNGPIYEQGHIDNALMVIKNKDTLPEQRLIIASLLKKMGYFVHGNLRPVGKAFKPEKICLFNFETPFMELKTSLRDIINNINKANHKAFDKRNKVIANIAFNLTFIEDGIKKRATVYLPIYIPDAEVEDKAGQHSEHALYVGLLKSGVFASILEKLPAEVVKGRQKDSSVIQIYKINAVVLQILSRFRSCDDCHVEGLDFLRGNDVLMALKQQLTVMNIKIPSKTHKGLAVAIQFCFDFSPLTEESENSYTRPLCYTEQKEGRGNFLAHGLFFQRQTRKLLDKPETVRQYTLFLSKGSYNLVSRLLNNPPRIKAIRDNILPLSEEKEDLGEALREWEYTGVFRELEEETSCGFCNYHAIKNEYDIVNVYNGNILSTGSVCITGFQNIRFFDEDDLPMHSEDARSTRKKYDKKSVSIKAVLAKLPHKEINFLKVYEEQGYFTPSQAVQLAHVMRESKNKKRFKIRINEENNDKFDNLSNQELAEIEKWCNEDQKEMIKQNKAKQEPKKKGASQLLITSSKYSNKFLTKKPGSQSSSTQSQYTSTDELPSSPSADLSLHEHSSSSSAVNSDASFFRTPKKSRSENLRLLTSPKGIDFRKRIAEGLKSSDKPGLIEIVNEIKTLWLQKNAESALNKIKLPGNHIERKNYLDTATKLVDSARTGKDNVMLGNAIYYIQSIIGVDSILDATDKSALTLLSRVTHLLENKPIPTSQSTVTVESQFVSRL